MYEEKEDGDFCSWIISYYHIVYLYSFITLPLLPSLAVQKISVLLSKAIKLSKTNHNEHFTKHLYFIYYQPEYISKECLTRTVKLRGPPYKVESIEQVGSKFKSETSSSYMSAPQIHISIKIHGTHV